MLLGFGAAPGAALNLSPGGDLREAAANLFAHLHALDAMGAARIAVSPIPETRPRPRHQRPPPPRRRPAGPASTPRNAQ